jgi:thioesterase domain-containing protein
VDPRIRPSPLFAEFPSTALTGSIPARFADQVARHGAHLAVQSHAIALTYQELDWASSRVAELVLGVLGARPHRVALLLGQGAPLVAAILGVLKAGHAYVALDPAQPRARLESMLLHARPGLCLADVEHLRAKCVILARHLGPGLRLVALAPRDVADGRVPPSIETMAAAHLSRLRALQLRGPYRLAGHCSAGVVAFEMARQLHAAGETIAALVLIEPPPLRAVRARDGRLRALGPGVSGPAWRAWRRIHGLARRARVAAAEGDLRGAVWRVLRARWSRPGHAHAATTGARWVGRVYADAVARYAPGQYAGLVTCLRTRASQAAGEFEPGSWREAVDRLRVEIAPGDHESCLTAEARALAARLRACAEATPSTGP